MQQQQQQEAWMKQHIFLRPSHILWCQFPYNQWSIVTHYITPYIYMISMTNYIVYTCYIVIIVYILNLMIRYVCTPWWLKIHVIIIVKQILSVVILYKRYVYHCMYIHAYSILIPRPQICYTLKNYIVISKYLIYRIDTKLMCLLAGCYYNACQKPPWKTRINLKTSQTFFGNISVQQNIIKA